MGCSVSTGSSGCDEEIEFFAGDFPWFLQYVFSLDEAPVDLSDLTMVLVFKAALTDADADAVRTINFPVPAGADAVNGNVTVVFGQGDIAALPPGVYFLKSKTSTADMPPTVQTWGDPVRIIVSA